jgi:hypothetical protein
MSLALGAGFWSKNAGKSVPVPFYGCPECGWATSASSSTATQAHQMGVPECGGELELVDDWLLPGDEPEDTAIRETARRLRIARARSGD